MVTLFKNKAFRQIFSAILADKLSTLGMKKKDLAYKIGVSPKDIYTYTDGYTLPSIAFFFRICSATNTDPVKFFEEVEEMEQQMQEQQQQQQARARLLRK